MNCAICKKQIEPRTAAVEFVGGLFDQGDPEFFVVDEGVMIPSHTHLNCLLEAIAAVQGNR